MFLATTHAAETAAAAEAAAEHGETLDPLSHIFNSEYWELTHGLRVNIHDLLPLPTLRLGALEIDLSLSLHVVMLWVAALLLWLLLAAAARREEAHVPRGRLRNFFEAIVVFLRDEVVYNVMGPEVGRRYMPFLMTLFFFILFNNLLGLVPGMAAATGNLNVTGTLAAFTLVMTQGSGIREHGLAGHLRGLVPPGMPILLAPVMLPIEIMGMFTKPFALTVRLFANMIAGHIIILAFFGLIFSLSLKSIYWSVLPWAGAVAISAFEIFVSFLQAFIFVFLSTIFIHQAVHPEH
ncbi:MAG: F0F1 ATP synthase subunit A [Candidatus Krumholzibacteriota bacterium]|nr:F0F1 ATP synthase subunit A [Candidatus Krumholzibacteriota bacterium]